LKHFIPSAHVSIYSYANTLKRVHVCTRVSWCNYNCGEEHKNLVQKSGRGETFYD